MNCPNCSQELKIAERKGIEIDYCPSCRGVWLDRGELDKIIERSTEDLPGSRAEASPAYPGKHGSSHGDKHGGKYGDKHGYKQGRRKGLLRELFDAFD
jgi:Zn-finger nucleic acid-binding protein